MKIWLLLCYRGFVGSREVREDDGLLRPAGVKRVLSVLSIKGSNSSQVLRSDTGEL